MNFLARLTTIAVSVPVAIGAIGSSQPAQADHQAGYMLSQIVDRLPRYQFQIQGTQRQLQRGRLLNCNFVSVNQQRQITRLCAPNPRLSQP
ncbi:MAG: hypothetical protein EA001_12020 [Oscillatoriales cyanobacterium]|nr:MAG: hypothetical protein EA001_12020 [Oscillatoriales cyanobacterium]